MEPDDHEIEGEQPKVALVSIERLETGEPGIDGSGENEGHDS
jgi:hypothetical protein